MWSKNWNSTLPDGWSSSIMLHYTGTVAHKSFCLPQDSDLEPTIVWISDVPHRPMVWVFVPQQEESFWNTVTLKKWSLTGRRKSLGAGKRPGPDFRSACEHVLRAANTKTELHQDSHCDGLKPLKKWTINLHMLSSFCQELWSNWCWSNLYRTLRAVWQWK